MSKNRARPPIMALSLLFLGLGGGEDRNSFFGGGLEGLAGELAFRVGLTSFLSSSSR